MSPAKIIPAIGFYDVTLYFSRKSVHKYQPVFRKKSAGGGKDGESFDFVEKAVGADELNGVQKKIKQSGLQNRPPC